MQFGSRFERFLQASPIPVMYRALLERALDPQQLDQLFHDTAQTQRTRELLFSAMVKRMFAVVSKAHPSVRAAYFASLDEVMTTLTDDPVIRDIERLTFEATATQDRKIFVKRLKPWMTLLF